MLAFIIRRIVWTIPVILVVILMTFLHDAHDQGDSFQNSDVRFPFRFSATSTGSFHLYQPWYNQYLYYVKGVATLDLGPSLVLRNQTVNDIVKEHFPVSIWLGVLALLFAIVVGIPLGILAALKQNSAFDYTAMTVANLGFALPSFLVATLFIYFFALRLKDYTHLPTNGWDSPQSWVLPAIALGIYPMTYFARLVRGTMLETLQQDYVRTAKAKGLRWRVVVTKHVLRNSLIPAVTATAPLLGYLITGSFIIETIFGIPGIGRYYVISVQARDYSVVMGITVLLAFIIIFANLVVDILYGFLDPRTRDART